MTCELIYEPFVLLPKLKVLEVPRQTESAGMSGRFNIQVTARAPIFAAVARVTILHANRSIRADHRFIAGVMSRNR